jgi:hypothetical protein
MVILGLERGIPVGMNNTIEDLVENTLFDAYDEDIQNFLLELSIMDSFTAKQAFFVTHEERTDKILKKLCQENAFVFYDEVNRTYKIHNVLTDGDFFYQGMAFNYIVYGKAVVLTKNYVKLEMLTESFEEYFSVFSNQLGFIHNSIFKAVAKYNLYGIRIIFFLTSENIKIIDFLRYDGNHLYLLFEL